ncbi:MAG TPA: hypothetical protein VNX46_10615, partial [Candidatus Acidoferrum sp.]|nr:hypothetical protein [Candidatus Acidoferrum sp.]
MSNTTINVIIAFTLCLCLEFKTSSVCAEDLIPAMPGNAPNYWCTWSVQNYMFGQGATTLDAKELEGPRGAEYAGEAIKEQNVFGRTGWATTFLPRVRGDLYLMYDAGLCRNDSKLFLVDERKFPFVAGLDGQNRLLKLNERTRALGWRGVAVWCTHPATNEDAAITMMRWSRYASIGYWKIDCGDDDFTLMTFAARLCPGLILEHAAGSGPFNGDWQKEVGRFGKIQPDNQEAQCLEHSDVFRTYDVSPALSFPTTLDRVADVLRYENQHQVRALINAEDEVYLAATLGCTMGIMRHPLIGLRPNDDPDPFFNCPRQCKRRMDEVVRALHWQRLAPPFGSYSSETNAAGQPQARDMTEIDDEILVDSWTFKRGETWLSDAIGKTVQQGAPARVSRGLPLAEVHIQGGPPPFVIAGRFPNGAVAVAVQGRTTEGKSWIFTPTDVTVNVGATRGPFGIFGRYHSLTLRFDAPLGNVRILAQDLAGKHAKDITKKVAVNGN